MLDAKYFITKFQAIPERKFGRYYQDGLKKCYFGHCSELESSALYKLLRKINTNAGAIIYSKKDPYRGKSLKQRILIALNNINNIQS